MEERYFADAQTFEHLVELETELVDSYAHGRLSTEMRERFERAYLVNPNRRARLRFSEALTTKLDEAASARVADDRPIIRTASSGQRFSSTFTGKRRALAFSMALVLLLLTSMSIWLFIQSNRLRQDLALSRQEQISEEQRAREAQQQLADEQTKTQQLAAELERERTEQKPQPQPTMAESPKPVITTTTAVPPVASLVLIASNSRSVDTARAPGTLVIHKETEQVRIQLKLKENEYQSYQLSLQAIGGREVFNRQNIKPVNNKSGASFIISLPASRIGAGDYILTLRGFTRSGEPEDVSQSLFRVERE